MPVSQEEREEEGYEAWKKSCGDGWLNTGGKGPERWGKVEEITSGVCVLLYIYPDAEPDKYMVLT